MCIVRGLYALNDENRMMRYAEYDKIMDMSLEEKSRVGTYSTCEIARLREEVKSVIIWP